MSAAPPSDYRFDFNGTSLLACGSGALIWPGERLLCVSDLHFGKAQRSARQGGGALPPYETLDTLHRLDADIAHYRPDTVICLGDSFDALQASQDLDPQARDWITRLQAGRRWIWIEGNHDPGPIALGGSHMAQWQRGPLRFRHIAAPDLRESGEVSGHYHPKIQLNLRRARITRRCFALDGQRLILPAYGTYTGGLNVRAKPLDTLLGPDAICILTGATPHALPRAQL